ncbi:MAG: ATP-dependent Clp protease adaptor ClpS [Blastopirellula sp. JB062]
MTPADTAVTDAPATQSDSKTDPREQTRRQPPYVVILRNDDLNTFDFVIETLRKVFGYELEKCVKLALAAHNHGQSAIWSGPLEVAELKADQVRSRGADPQMKSRGARPLRVSVEPLPQ